MLDVGGDLLGIRVCALAWILAACSTSHQAADGANNGAASCAEQTCDGGTAGPDPVSDAGRLLDARGSEPPVPDPVSDAGQLLDAGGSEPPVPDPVSDAGQLIDAGGGEPPVPDPADRDASIPDASDTPPAHGAGVDASMAGAPEFDAGPPPCERDILTQLVNEAGRLTEQTEDLDCDGVADFCLYQTYLDDGEQLRYRIEDEGCDGVWERCDENVYAARRLVRATVDEGCDGRFESCRLLEYNGYDQLLRVTLAESCEAPPDECTDFVYDNGLLLQVVQVQDCSGASPICDHRVKSGVLRLNSPSDLDQESYVDEGCDGTRDRDCYLSPRLPAELVDVANLFSDLPLYQISDLFADPPVCPLPGNSSAGLAFGATPVMDEDCDGSPEHGCRSMERDDSGRVVRTGMDADCDGMPEEDCVDIAYAADGRGQHLDVDEDCDGHVDTYLRRTFDGAGKLAQEQSRERDTNYIGVYDCATTHYGPTEQETRYEFDDRCDGTIDRCTRYHYDAQDRLTGEGSCDAEALTVTYAYDAAGNRVLERWDSRCLEQTFDDAGRLVEWVSGATCGGGPDSTCESYRYDSQGRFTEFVTGRCGQAPSRHQSYTYLGSDPEAVDVREERSNGTSTCTRYTEGPDGERTWLRIDDDCDGTYDLCQIRMSGLNPADRDLLDACGRWRSVVPGESALRYWDPNCIGFADPAVASAAP